MAVFDDIISYFKFDESSGTAADSVSGVNPLTNTGSVLFSAGKSNNAIVLTTTGQKMAKSSNFGIASSSTAFSWSFWVKMTSEIGSSAVYFLSLQIGVGAGYENIQYEYNAGSRRVSAENSGARCTAALGTVWNHIVYTRTALGVTKIYVNGVLGGTTGTVVASGGGSAEFSVQATTSFEHMIDELGFWSRDLTLAEVTALYNSGNGYSYPSGSSFGPPTLTTNPVTNVAITTATANGEVVSDGGNTITERGFVLSTSPSPTTSNTKFVVSGTTGSYSGSITGLTAGTTYYIRAYAITSFGTGYGLDESFVTDLVSDDDVVLDINGVDGDNYAVQLNIGGTVGTLTVKLGTTGASQTFAAGAGVSVMEGVYGGLSGLILTASADFNGNVDDVFYVLVTGEADINWTLNILTNIFSIDSEVLFKRIEAKEFNIFRFFRYLDLMFKDLDARVSVTIRQEQSDNINDKVKEFLVDNPAAITSPFIKKKISFLSKSQAVLIGLSNNRLDETFTICKFDLKGYEDNKRLFKGSNIISVV